MSFGAAALPENIRLIIWDLDETFWEGTLTEGGIRVRPETCELVIELARRGIMSSICSKNDLADVRAILVEHQVWDYFIFPSINWESKGPRIAALIEQVQLRPPTVLFIDDNPLNLQEAKHFVPDIQLRGENFIPSIAGDPLFRGKDDSALKRLSQYKLLERRKADEQSAGPDVTEFLRASNIRVELEPDIAPHIDRVVELINRTNQLNFTKVRLPEDPEEAREQALELFRRYNMQVGLVRVSDRYGDHGFSGFYAYNSDAKRLVHFCFSCRILGMSVEHWIYERLGRPAITIQPEVLSDLIRTRAPVDWINQSAGASDGEAVTLSLGVDRLIAHGGCDLAAVSHYFAIHGIEVVPEFNLSRHGMALRTDHSVFLRYSQRALTPAELSIAERLCYKVTDFETALCSSVTDGQCVVLSFATDAHHALYRHRETGLQLPCMIGLGPVYKDARAHEIAELPLAEQSDVRGRVLATLKSEFDFTGLITEAEFKTNVFEVLDRTRGARVFVLQPQEYHLNKSNGSKIHAASFAAINHWTSEVAKNYPNVQLINMGDFVDEPSEIENILHYDRKVYFRLYRHIVDRMLQCPSSTVANSVAA